MGEISEEVKGMIRGITGEYDIAKLAYTLGGGDMDDRTLSVCLSEEVCRVMCMCSAAETIKAATCDDADTRERYTEVSKRLLEIAGKLKTTAYKRNVIEEYKCICHASK